jgi:ABC-2 type transport system ATP-binding protein
MVKENGLLLRVENLKKHYGEVRAVDGISFTVPKGVVFTILGPNGAGKTTTLEMLEGIRDPDSGEIEIFGMRLKRITRDVKERIGVLLQESNFERYLKVKEVLTLFASFFQKTCSIQAILTQVALEEKAEAYVKNLSGGQRQRLAIGVTLINDPELIFFDEPTTGLDPQARRNIWEIIAAVKERDKTIILTTHNMEEAEKLSDHICIMDHGKIIAAGTPRQLTAELQQETIIEFNSDGVDKQQLQSINNFSNGFQVNEEIVIVKSANFVQTMDRLLHWAQEKEIPLKNIVVRQPNIEDVFLSLTGRRLRE